MQDEHALSSPLRAPCKATRPPEHRWGAGAAPRIDWCGRLLGAGVPCPPCLWSVIDPPRGSRRHAAPLDGGPPERRDESLWAWDDCRTPVCHTQSWMCAEQQLCDTPRQFWRASLLILWLHDAVVSPSLHHSVPLAFPCWDNSRQCCYTLRQAGGE